MSEYDKLLTPFQESIMTGRHGNATPLVKDKHGFSAHAQMDIYVRGYRIRLSKALAADFPTLRHYMGERAFNALCNDYIQQHPPIHYNLEHYTFPFPAFVQRITRDVVAVELAALEGAIHEAYYAEEDIPLDPLTLADGVESAMESLNFPLRSTARFLAFSTNAPAYLAALRENSPIVPNKEKPSYMLVYKHQHYVRRAALENGEAQILSALAKGKNLGEALSLLAFPPAAEQVERWFFRWVSEGFLQEIVKSNKDSI